MKRAAQLIGIILIVALGYDGWIFWSRWNEAKASERARSAQETELARKTLKVIGGPDLKINSFYVSPAAVQKGSPANICYGVVGAKQLRIEPPVAEVWPALNRCIQVAPSKNTAYKLIASNAEGKSVSESFVLQVVP